MTTTTPAPFSIPFTNDLDQLHNFPANIQALAERLAFLLPYRRKSTVTIPTGETNADQVFNIPAGLYGTGVVPVVSATTYGASAPFTIASVTAVNNAQITISVRTVSGAAVGSALAVGVDWWTARPL